MSNSDSVVFLDWFKKQVIAAVFSDEFLSQILVLKGGNLVLEGEPVDVPAVASARGDAQRSPTMARRPTRLTPKSVAESPASKNFKLFLPRPLGAGGAVFEHNAQRAKTLANAVSQSEVLALAGFGAQLNHQ